MKIIAITPLPSADEAAAIDAALRSFFRAAHDRVRSRWAAFEPLTCDVPPGETWIRAARREAIVT